MCADSRPKANAALAVLAALASRSSDACQALFSAVDWSLAALPRLAKPPAAAAVGAGSSVTRHQLLQVRRRSVAAGRGARTSRQGLRPQQMHAHGLHWQQTACGLVLGQAAPAGAHALQQGLPAAVPWLGCTHSLPVSQEGTEGSWATWGARALGKRPSRALFVGFGELFPPPAPAPAPPPLAYWLLLEPTRARPSNPPNPHPPPRPPARCPAATALLRTADPQLLPRLLSTRPLMAGLLTHLASDPPAAVVGVLRLLAQRVAGAAPGSLAPRSRAAAWGDAALAQLALLCGREVEGPGGEGAGGEEGEGEGAARPAKRRKAGTGGAEGAGEEWLAVQAAYEMLHLLLTDGGQGLVAAALPAAAGGGGQAEPGAAAAGAAPGREGGGGLGRALRLHPGDSVHHLRLLAAAAAAQPALAAELLAALPYNLEPSPCTRWGPPPKNEGQGAAGEGLGRGRARGRGLRRLYAGLGVCLPQCSVLSRGSVLAAQPSCFPPLPSLPLVPSLAGGWQQRQSLGS